MAKETYVYGKRDLLVWQKRPTCMAKETYVYGKRDLATYLYGKRDLRVWQKRPTRVAKEAYLQDFFGHSPHRRPRRQNTPVQFSWGGAA